MQTSLVDVTHRDRINALADRVMAGGSVEREEALWLFGLEQQADITDLMAAANRLREHFKGNKIHLCSIVNAKAGGCSENCKFCSCFIDFEVLLFFLCLSRILLLILSMEYPRMMFHIFLRYR